jgi:hypothetical protein
VAIFGTIFSLLSRELQSSLAHPGAGAIMPARQRTRWFRWRFQSVGNAREVNIILPPRIDVGQRQRILGGNGAFGIGVNRRRVGDAA